MFGPAGHAYVYFNYGVHWMLNVTAHTEGEAAAVLIRAAEPLEGLEEMRQLRPKARRDQDLLSGPGKLAAAFEISSAHNGLSLFDPRSEVRLEPGNAPQSILCGPRIGIPLGREHPWRFVALDGLEWASSPREGFAPP
jgi:DNA-3-methyladenine glycosylase